MARKDLKKDAKPKPKLKPKAKAKESFKAHRDGLVPVVYQDMLAEAESSLPSNLGDDGRTIKKRRVGGRLIGSVKVEPERPQDLEGDVEAQISIDRDETASPRPPQTIDVESEDMTDSDAAWEEVNLKDISEMESLDGDEDEKDSLIDLVLDSKLGSAHKHIVRRKPMSTEIRKTRLAIHKLHLLCLLSHVYLRNHWCNDEQVQVGCLLPLRPVLTTARELYGSSYQKILCHTSIQMKTSHNSREIALSWTDSNRLVTFSEANSELQHEE